MLVDTAIRKSVNIPPCREMKIGCGQREESVWAVKTEFGRHNLSCRAPAFF